MAEAFPMLMNGNLDAVCAGKAVDAVPHIQWWLRCYKLHAERFGNIKLV